MKTKKHTLFSRIFSSFMFVIVLLLVSDFISNSYFQSIIKSEVFKYNEVNLDNTVDNFENFISYAQNTMLHLYFDEDIAGIDAELLYKLHEDINYWAVDQIVKKINNIVIDPNVKLDNLLIVYRDQGVTIGRTGFNRIADIRNQYLPDSFWVQLWDHPDGFTVFPAQLQSASTGEQIAPIIFKSRHGRYAVIALIRQPLMLSSLHRSINKQFLVIDPNRENQVLIRTEETDLHEPLPLFHPADFHVVVKGNYLFYKTGNHSKLIYINVIPYQSISQQINKWNLILTGLSLVTLLIGLFVSLRLAGSFHKHAQELISSIRNQDPRSEYASKIREFDVIGKQINEMVRDNYAIRKDLSRQSMHLVTYQLVNKMKMIHVQNDRIRQHIPEQKPFILFLHHLHFKTHTSSKHWSPNRAAYYIREYIDVTITDIFPGSLTFPIELNEILTIIFAGHVGAEDMNRLQQMKMTLDNDRDAYLCTIAIGSPYQGSDSFHTAYEEVLRLAETRKLSNETEIVAAGTTARVQGHYKFEPLSPETLKDNTVRAIRAVEKSLDRMDQLEYPAKQFAEFANRWIHEVIAMVGERPEAPKDWEAQLQQLIEQREYYTLEQYKAFLGRVLTAAAAWLSGNKQGTDHVVAYVMDYIRHHGHEDISLDQIAHLLDMSPSYLSFYIKDKTGQNFITHLNATRMAKAKELLASSSRSIADIGQAVGYLNTTSFIRMFKRHTGVTPGDYRMHIKMRHRPGEA